MSMLTLHPSRWIVRWDFFDQGNPYSHRLKTELDGAPVGVQAIEGQT
jgi:hypothetical protein